VQCWSVLQILRSADAFLLEEPDNLDSVRRGISRDCFAMAVEAVALDLAFP
jgi:predicted RNase H-like nuclease